MLVPPPSRVVFQGTRLDLKAIRLVVRADEIHENVHAIVDVTDLPGLTGEVHTRFSALEGSRRARPLSSAGM